MLCLGDATKDQSLSEHFGSRTGANVIHANVDTRCRDVLWRAVALLDLFVAVGLLVSGEGAQGQQHTGMTTESAPVRSVAITIDDLPGAVPGTDKSAGKLRDLERENRQILHVLARHKVPAIGFVIEAKLQVSGERDARAALLEKWIDAGMELGNHTYSHMHFDDTSLEQFEDETVRGEVVTRALLTSHGKTEHYFRHPALSTGATQEAKTEFEAFLNSRGYQIAPVTVENADYQFNDVLDDARHHRDKKLAARTKAEYLKHTQANFLYAEDASRKLFNHEASQVLLIHDNEINAEVLDTLLTDLEGRGYRFVSLDGALSDPVYGTRETFIGNLGACYLCWRSRLAAVGHKLDNSAGPEPPAWVTKRFEEIRKAHTD
jgi:peptidoglycan/xylan/chitin deacetylase (PgdA/CDA1 family)